MSSTHHCAVFVLSWDSLVMVTLVQYGCPSGRTHVQGYPQSFEGPFNAYFLGVGGCALTQPVHRLVKHLLFCLLMPYLVHSCQKNTARIAQGLLSSLVQELGDLLSLLNLRRLADLFSCPLSTIQSSPVLILCDRKATAHEVAQQKSKTQSVLPWHPQIL